MINLRQLTWGKYLGLSRWALYPSISVFKREKKLITYSRGGRGERRGGNLSTEAEIGVVWPQVKVCQQSPEAVRIKELNAP